MPIGYYESYKLAHKMYQHYMGTQIPIQKLLLL
jgi:hypothetical protein